MTPNDRTEPGVCNGRCIGHASELSTSEWKPDPACPLHGRGQQPAQPGSGGVMDDAALEATFRHIERWSELDLPVCANLRIHCKAMQSALTATQRDRNTQYDRAQRVSEHNSRLWSEREALRDKLAAAQRENEALRNLAANLQPGPISEALSGQRYTTEKELRDQLTAAQQRIAEFEGKK